MQNTGSLVRNIVYTALFTALIIVGAYFSIPLPFSPVPIALSTFFVLLSGLVLGKGWGTLSSGIYLLLGALGFPVFSAGSGGLAYFLGPTGGYLLAYLIAPFITGAIAGGRKPSLIKDVTGLVAGSLCLYALGVPVLKLVTGLSWGKAIVAGVLPFLPGDSLKVVAAIGVIRVVRPVLSRLTSSSGEEFSVG